MLSYYENPSHVVLIDEFAYLSFLVFNRICLENTSKLMLTISDQCRF
jgi:hypothetical protein